MFVDASPNPPNTRSLMCSLVAMYHLLAFSDFLILFFCFFLFKGASVDSYLPEELSFSKVVGVGMNEEEMKNNPRLTDTLVQNLNNKVRRHVDIPPPPQTEQ